MKAVTIALIGCGAVAQKGYLPALALLNEVRCRWVIDAQGQLAQALAQRWKIPHAADDYGLALEDPEVEAVILAVPNHLHASMTLDALAKKKAVLCEKPLARTAMEARKMVEVAEQTHLPLVAGMTFRQYPPLQQIQKAFPWEVLGRIREVRASYGFPLDWPLSSPYLFDREKVGGGVLIDQGIHLVDSLFWVLSLREASVEEYFDDGESRMESEVKAHLSLALPEGRGQAPCLLEASRLRRLGNQIELFGDRASLVIPLSSTESPQLQNGNFPRPVFEHPVTPRSGTGCFAEQLRAFAKRIRGLEANCAEGMSQVRVMELVESCYMSRKPLTSMWETYEPWVKR